MQNVSKQALSINVSAESGLKLRSASFTDLENLRSWKNKEKQFFYHQQDITQTQQQQWFENYLQRSDDFMFMTVFEGNVFGCMGIRWKQDYWDIYNVIVGLPEYGGRGFMGHAFSAMLTYATKLKKAPITLEVLKNNPAVSWYQKQGFVIIETHENYYKMEFKTIELN